MHNKKIKKQQRDYRSNKRSNKNL